MKEKFTESLLNYFEDRIVLSNHDRELISSLYELRKYDKKELIFEQGELCRIESFVVKGSCKVFHIDNKGQEHILYFAFKDWWVGDITSYNSSDSAIMSAQALEETYVLCISPERKEQLFTKIPQLERMFRIITQRTLTVLQKRFLLAMSGSAVDRYLQLIERHPKIEQLVPQYQIASYLGILPESLSRIKKQLHAQSI